MSVALSCGPSYQAVYEGNLRFEHCYSLDIEAAQSTKYRERCWREWLKLYTYGQTRDRVEYAANRAAVLQRGETAAPFDPARGDAGSVPRAAAAPAPTSITASPPPTVPATEDAGARSTTADSGPTPPAPHDKCIGSCRGDWRGCVEKCDSPNPARTCSDCGKDYRRCMKRCFQ